MKQIQKDGCMVALKINNILTEALDQQWGRRKTKKVKTTGKATKAYQSKATTPPHNAEPQKRGCWLYLGNYLLKSNKCTVSLTNWQQSSHACLILITGPDMKSS